MMLVATLFLALAGAPQAAKAQPVDLTDPAVVATLVRDLGYKAESKVNQAGEPYIASAANGSSFTIEFYGCEAGKCTSMQFYAWYKKKPEYTEAFVNSWNTRKRFLKAHIDKDGDLATVYDITSLGGTRESFADSFDWWTVMTAELFTVMGDADPAKKIAS